ncbi:MAG: bifunctional UDP-N-acetylmuramoyl-tripeptide:D-alanyl-D-alanine ligase/alanine racemase, partial [Spirosomaceae bacterium]|nr:bifunctional UDP-N-acetylmuramoyl-tripeptide:D-alanyl-D-alanine ligase/alanine racemase [Spirosomataceae bacterium]
MKIFNTPVNTSAKYLLTDSRYVEQATESIFFAIKGERHDGHAFIEELYKKGVREFVVETGCHFNFNGKLVAVENLKEFQGLVTDESLIFWIVGNSILALQEVVAKHRKNFDIPIVGITGSNGKTIVKEWIYELLANKISVAKSPRSYNSQIGVPLSVWQLAKVHQLGVFEAGISRKNEMKKLADVIQPTIGIFTNIGSAHDEGFNSRKEKVAEKLRLFAKAKTLIYCKDYDEIGEEVNLLLKQINPGIELIGWSLHEGNDFFVEVMNRDGSVILKTNWDGESLEVEIPFVDDAAIENATHALFCILKTQGAKDLPDFKLLRPLKMRLEMKHGIYDSYLVDDSYNNDLAGLEMALNFLNQHNTKRDKLLILSDIHETGLEEVTLYETVKELLISKGISEIIGVGAGLQKHQPMPGLYYGSTEELLADLPREMLSNRFTLVKGARVFGFERIIKRLEQKVHGTVFEINLDSVENNLNFYRTKLKPPTKLMAMVKAYAYGSGSTEIAAFLQYHRVDYLAVAYTDEGVSLRENGIELPIMVLNPQPESYQNVLNYELEPEIYSLKSLRSWIEFLEFSGSLEEKINIHLKLDTGMHRLGFTVDELDEVINLIKGIPDFYVKSVFSHLSGADDRKFNDFTLQQIDLFTQMSDQIRAAFPYEIDRHICNTAGILSYPDAHFEMVRVGIGLYGVESSGG